MDKVKCEICGKIDYPYNMIKYKIEGDYYDGNPDHIFPIDITAEKHVCSLECYLELFNEYEQELKYNSCKLDNKDYDFFENLMDYVDMDIDKIKLIKKNDKLNNENIELKIKIETLETTIKTYEKLKTILYEINNKEVE